MRKTIERGFKSLSEIIFNNPWIVITVIVLMAACLAAQISRLQIDTGNESYFHKSDPTLTAYERFKDQFGWDEMIIVALETTEVFDLSFLKTLRRLHEDLAGNVPHLSDITSMVNARNWHNKSLSSRHSLWTSKTLKFKSIKT